MDGTMARKRHKPEEMVAKLRQVDVLTGQGQSIAEAVKTIAVTETSYFRWRAERPNHVWSYDFVEDRTHDGRKFRMLCVIDELSREALAIRVKRRLNAPDVLETLWDPVPQLCRHS
jgi:hypothetical protein